MHYCVERGVQEAKCYLEKKKILLIGFEPTPICITYPVTLSNKMWVQILIKTDLGQNGQSSNEIKHTGGIPVDWEMASYKQKVVFFKKN